ncbi:SRPBCC family protein [Streptomyces fungicidicus]|uniref:SRPBCC family protein n=1 Tax=Streptomyces fungicidicus TaxID=68203 RepID=UPI0033DD6E26
MTEYERAHTMPAPPEHVFDQAADIGRMSEWLPGDLHVHAGELPAVTVHEDRTDEDVSALFRARRDQMRLELSFFDDSHDPGEQTVGDALDTSLRRLEDQVRLRVDNAAG